MTEKDFSNISELKSAIRQIDESISDTHSRESELHDLEMEGRLSGEGATLKREYGKLLEHQQLDRDQLQSLLKRLENP